MKYNGTPTKISHLKQENYRKRGFYLLLLDYIFIICIMYNIAHTYNLFLDILAIRRYVVFNFAWIINVFQFPAMLFIGLLLFSIRFQFQKSESLMRRTLIPFLLAFAFSLLFKGTIQEFVPSLPERYHPNVLFKYYASYLLIGLFFFVRIVFSFYYYQAFFLKDRNDFRIHFAIILYLLLMVIRVWKAMKTSRNPTEIQELFCLSNRAQLR